jgi:GTP-binding protein HflX
MTGLCYDDEADMTDIRTTVSVQRERAVLAAALLPDLHLDPRDPFAELKSLAATAGAVPVAELAQTRQRPDASTFIGKGKVEELAGLVELHEADVVIFENDLSPAQLRNVEQIVEKKVIDRSELILDIFAARARTYEAKLQVELAQLEYTYPRLRAMWSHLERIVGGAPAGIGTRGPGEQQLEIDRRIVQRRKAELRREIDKVQSRKQRQVAQRNVDFYTVGIVGYTNAGKSTLFNTLTDARAYADNKLFATLDTRTRRWDLGGGDSVMLSDTVGFVRHLPHHLVASFRATLEESIHSDLLLIVLDVSDPEVERQFETVNEVLEQIGAGERPRLLLLNKIDQLEDNAEVLLWQQEHPEALPISARGGLGLDALVERVRQTQAGLFTELVLRVPMTEGKAISFIENRAEVRDRQYDSTHVDLNVRIGRRQLDQLRAMGAAFETLEPQST